MWYSPKKKLPVDKGRQVARGTIGRELQEPYCLQTFFRTARRQAKTPCALWRKLPIHCPAFTVYTLRDLGNISTNDVCHLVGHIGVQPQHFHSLNSNQEAFTKLRECVSIVWSQDKKRQNTQECARRWRGRGLLGMWVTNPATIVHQEKPHLKQREGHWPINWAH